SGTGPGRDKRVNQCVHLHCQAGPRPLKVVPAVLRLRRQQWPATPFVWNPSIDSLHQQPISLQGFGRGAMSLYGLFFATRKTNARLDILFGDSLSCSVNDTLW